MHCLFGDKSDKTGGVESGDGVGEIVGEEVEPCDAGVGGCVEVTEALAASLGDVKETRWERMSGGRRPRSAIRLTQAPLPASSNGHVVRTTATLNRIEIETLPILVGVVGPTRTRH